MSPTVRIAFLMTLALWVAANLQVGEARTARQAPGEDPGGIALEAAAGGGNGGDAAEPTDERPAPPRLTDADLAGFDAGRGAATPSTAAIDVPVDAVARELLAAVGRPVPPGLTAQRASVLRGARDAALEALRRRPREEMVALLQEQLTDPAVSHERWRRAVWVVGELGLVELAVQLGQPLAHSPDSVHSALVGRALFELYGTWFESYEQLEPFANAGRCFAGRDLLVAQEHERTELLNRLWRLDPSAMLEGLADRSPIVRANAARQLVEATRVGDAAPANGAAPQSPDAGPALEVDVVIGALVRAARAETDVHVACEVLHAIAALGAGLGADSERVAELRSLLTDFQQLGPDELLHCVARCIVSLPGTLTPGDSWANERLLLIMNRVVHPDSAPEPQPDVVVGVLETMRSRAREVDALPSGEPGRPLLRTDLRELARPVLGLLSNSGTASQVRQAAAAAMRDLADPADLPELHSAFESYEQDTALRFTLFGVFERLAEDGDLTPEEVDELAKIAGEAISSGDVDLRGRGLALLDALKVETQLPPGVLENLVAVLPELEDPDSTQSVFRLVMEHGSAVELGRLLESEATRDVLVQNGPLLDELAASLRETNDAVGRLAAADQLFALAEKEDDTRFALRALQIAVPADEQEREQLGAALGADAASAHARLVEFARVLAEDPLSARRIEGAADLVASVLDHHLEPAQSLLDEMQYLDDRARFHVLATPASTEMDAALAEALESALTGGEPTEAWTELALLRARTSYQDRTPERALEAYEAVVERAPDSLLLRDRRRIVRAALQVAEANPQARAESIDRAIEVSKQVLADSEWNSRMSDGAAALEDLESLAQALDRRPEREGLELLRANVPPVLEADTEPDSSDPLAVLAATPEMAERLGELRERVGEIETHLAALEAGERRGEDVGDHTSEDPEQPSPEDSPEGPPPDDSGR